MKFLLVDDDPDVRLIASYLLRAAGHSVSEAADSAAAARLVASEHFDVVLMDVMLGEEDGVDAALRLRQEMPAAVLIFLTAASRAEQLERMHSAGAGGVVQKPFAPETFVSTIEQLVSGSA